MNLLGIDYGQRRIGVALAAGVCFASPLVVIENRGFDNVIQDLNYIINEYGINKIVVGVPYTLKNTKSIQTQEVLDFIKRLEDYLGIPVEQEDERLSSRLAETYQKQGADDSLHDALAAMAILQTYLDKTS